MGLIFMYGFAKVLGSNESGYSGNMAGKRGKFILVPKDALVAFPPLSTGVLNDQAVIRCVLLDRTEIALNVVYHNAKFFPQTHDRAHNEVRIYRNELLETGLRLDRGVVIVFLPITLGNYFVFSVHIEEPSYQFWKDISGKAFELSSVMNRSDVKKALATEEQHDVKNLRDISFDVISRTTVSRRQQPANHSDPAKPLSSLISTQSDFSKYLREMWGGKCALRQESLIENDPVGLDAAHIQPHSHEGPLLPTNGMLLSSDLHRAFEKGVFTLTAKHTVEVHSSVPTSSKLWEYNAKTLSCAEGFEMFLPHAAYVEYHRDNIFNNFSCL